MNVLTQYKIKAELVDQQLTAINEFVEALKVFNNPDIKFTAYQLTDKVSFRHVIYIKDTETAKELMSQPFYAALGDGTTERCEEEPTFSPMEMVATFKIG